jgi:siroheme synthase-like protein
MTSNSSDTLRFLPVALSVQGKSCIVVGGGDVGTRKVMTLARAGAEVTVVSPTVTAELAAEIDAGRIGWVKDEFRSEHLGGAFLAVAATNDETTNRAVGRAAAERGALVCDASSAERSRLIFGALLERKDVTIAVFTGGRDPALARRTRDQIARLIAQEEKPTTQP